MNKLKIASTGYPGTTKSWKFIKGAYEMIADVLGKVIDINDAVILTGMKVTGNDISDGYMSYNGEIYQFKGGTFTGTIVLVEHVTNVEYNTDPANSGQLQSLPTYYKRYARNGQAGEGFKDIAYDDFVRLDSLINISERTKQATENKKGIAEIATQAEANGNTDDTRIITPKKLAARTATETRKGVAEIATQTEVNAGTDDARIVTPKKLQEKLNNSTFGVVAEFVIDNVDAAGATGNVHFSVTGVSNYAVLASFVTDTQINENDNFYFRWFVKNKDNTGFDFLYEIGSQISQSELGKIQIVILKVS